MSLIERVANAKTLWSMVLNFVSIPEDRCLVFWLNNFDDKLVEHGFIRASKKFSGKDVSVPEDVHRYISSVMSKERQRQFEQEEQIAEAKKLRLSEGRCPTHGLPMSQISVYEEDSNGKEFCYGGCPRNDCNLAAKFYEPFGQGFELCELKKGTGFYADSLIDTELRKVERRHNDALRG